MTPARAEVRLEARAARQFGRAPRSVQLHLRRRARALAEDPFLGAFVPLRRTPRSTVRRWESRVGSIPNLYRLALPEGWRALYAVGSDGPLRVVLVLEALDHRGYDRLLGYG
jgi:hypothetical protein